jgi:hypothetical protein
VSIVVLHVVEVKATATGKADENQKNRTCDNRVGSYLFFAPVEEAAIPMSSTVAAEPVTV